MPWLNHPAYVRLRDSLIRNLRRDVYDFRRTHPIILLCGANVSPGRDSIKQFLQHRRDARVFYAEDVWFQLAQDRSLNALELEAELAALADLILILVESPGTFAELGAFANSKELRQKLLPVLDLEYRDHQSFINTGPVRWIEKDSQYGPAIHADFRAVLTSSHELSDRLSLIPGPPIRRLKPPQLRDSKLHLLIFLSELIGVIGPVTVAHLDYYLRELTGPLKPTTLPSLLSLGVSLRLIASERIDSLGTFYLRPIDSLTVGHATPLGPVAFRSERAKILDALQRIPEGVAALSLHEANP